ncbi:MAG TPA: glycogen/starch/alpha-glucan phosphorylase [Candidatus Scatomonas pullistercoris]|uniref:Alpha-1,4 glucan phosphorylase n=1 Tax=Candidatus Scatomonas pullistercoris TaxID=2840920 RepID=A0A9D1P1X7_9FIRM|nr:glycogen/starch/alpha-glucan phosphorylase [Candidatus Scatomonas pullistercoris]
MEERLEQLLKEKFGRGIDNCTKMEIFDALMRLTREELKGRPQIEGKKKLYYISAEFLIGKLLSNNLINLGIYDSINEILEKHKISLSEIEEMELEPSLGNGGLGRLAACFLDSIATLGLPGDGVGLNYHFGLFRQEFFHNKQKEVKNPWISENSWLERQPVSFRVPFKHFTLRSVLYDIIVPGYENGCNRLHLFDLDTVDETMVGNENINFQKENIQKNLTLFLYPDDSDVQGQLLRIYQQYFMVSNAAQLILKECEDKGVDLHRLNEHVVVQINDTHPSMVIPELIRLLQERGFMMDEAIEVVEKTCAYTNHTILAEALEKWPVSYLEQVAPQLMPIIRELDARVKARYADEAVHIIDKDQKVHMAHMDIHYGFSVNGVAALHTEILKRSELKPFCDIYPEKFNNKTNGITFRRWLKHCNPELAALVEELAGREVWKDSGRLEELMKYRKNKEILDKLERIKKHNKKKLCRYLYETQNLSVDPDSVFDIQIKRLHEYKRQQMNALYVIYKYLEIKSGKRPERPITVLFGAKAAPAYTIAKDIIHLILCLQQLLERDPEVSPWFRVAMVENYNVTKASKLIPAADISEQISLASKEASGTGNMKFMLNGAVTLGTEDGANVEIHELVGDDNIYIFGKKPAEVIKLYEEKGYRSRSYYENDPQIRELVDFIVSEEVMRLGDPICLDRLHHELINKDWFMTLLDLKEYIQVRDRMYRDYEDRDAWNEKALVNIARAGFFSSDRTIEEYNRDIWHLK